MFSNEVQSNVQENVSDKKELELLHSNDLKNR